MIVQVEVIDRQRLYRSSGADGKVVWSVLDVDVPAPERDIGLLSGVHPDCFFTVSVNTNATPTQPVLDNLRFN